MRLLKTVLTCYIRTFGASAGKITRLQREQNTYLLVLQSLIPKGK